MKKIFCKIYTLGCKVNQCDSRFFGEELNLKGFEFVDKDAEWAIINSCAVTEAAIKKSRWMINRARKENPKAKIILMGCWPRTYKIRNKNLADYILDIKPDKSGLEELSNIISPKQLNVIKQSKKKISLKSRYFLKIQDGCEQFCTYCIIPYARGKIKSVPTEKIISEVKKAINNGFTEIILCGIHLGLYGKDEQNENSLFTLLKKIIKIKGLGRIRLSSIEMSEVGVDLIKLIADNKKICPHLHLPLQSGSNKILKLMNRPYTQEEFIKKIVLIRKYIPKISLTSDVIVGFPGETEIDFKNTYNLIKKAGFNRLHVFPYSAHKKTPAANFTDQINKEVKNKRAKELRILDNELRIKYQRKFINKKLEILVEKIDNNQAIGKSEYYFDVRVPIKNRELTIGKIYDIKWDGKIAV